MILDIRTGRVLTSLVLASHYRSCACLCDGISSFLFAEDKIILLGAGRKQSLAADVFLFW